MTHEFRIRLKKIAKN